MSLLSKIHSFIVLINILYYSSNDLTSLIYVFQFWKNFIILEFCLNDTIDYLQRR